MALLPEGVCGTLSGQGRAFFIPYGKSEVEWFDDATKLRGAVASRTATKVELKPVGNLVKSFVATGDAFYAKAAAEAAPTN